MIKIVQSINIIQDPLKFKHIGFEKHRKINIILKPCHLKFKF